MILSLDWAFRWSPRSSMYLRTSWTQVYWSKRHFSCFVLFLFTRILAFLISRRSMLGECQGAFLPFGVQRLCRSRRKLCSCPFMVRASSFLLNIVWTFCAFTKKARFLSGVFILWDLLAAEASVKRERAFGTPVLRRSRKIRVKRKTLTHRRLLWWTRRVSILKPTDPCRFVWSPASFVAYPQHWEQITFGGPPCQRVH